MEIMGTNFTITLGSWRFRFCFAVDDVDVPEAAKPAPHHVRFTNSETYSRREA
jgi:hypothetical protein